jgi:hypothetical protein
MSLKRVFVGCIIPSDSSRSLLFLTASLWSLHPPHSRGHHYVDCDGQPLILPLPLPLTAAAITTVFDLCHHCPHSAVCVEKCMNNLFPLDLWLNRPNEMLMDAPPSHSSKGGKPHCDNFCCMVNQMHFDGIGFKNPPAKMQLLESPRNLLII